MDIRRRGMAATVATMVLGVVGSALGGAPAHAVSTDQSYWVPVSKKITVTGRGYGHGHGMSQYGAQGAALKGLTYRQIASFYYPGTRWRKVGGTVRVLITADTSDDVVVANTPGLKVRNVATGSVRELPWRPGVKRWRLVAKANGGTAVQFYNNRWRPFRWAWARNIAREAEFFADGPVTLIKPSGSTRYRGILRSAAPRPGSTSRDTVNIVTMDEYVMGVVPTEMPASWHLEAVKSQAVAARTYATWSRSQNWNGHYQICDTTSCQVYGGMDAEHPRSNKAVRQTWRQILVYGGKPAFTQFSSSSGGWTSAGSVPYLKAQEDPYDGWDGNAVHRWSTTVDAGVLERSYPALGRLQRIRVTQRDGNGEWQGRVSSLVLDGTRRDVTISGDQFRWAFGLRSNWFSIEPTPIMSRWAAVGGAARLGPVRSAEVPLAAGAAQRFARGRIFHSRATGARELSGWVLSVYNRQGGPKSSLGFPKTGLIVKGPYKFARFQNGAIYVRPRRSAMVVPGPIERRYLRARAFRGRLGWIQKPAYAVRGGVRVDYAGGSIVWNRATGRTRVIWR